MELIKYFLPNIKFSYSTGEIITTKEIYLPKSLNNKPVIDVVDILMIFEDGSKYICTIRCGGLYSANSVMWKLSSRYLDAAKRAKNKR